MMQRDVALPSFVRPNSKSNLELAWKSMVNALLLWTLVSAGSIFAQAQISSFQHVVIIFQENRTPDNLFQGLCGTDGSLCPTPYDLQSWGLNKAGVQVPLVEYELGNTYDPQHGHMGFLDQCDRDGATNECKMDGLSSTDCPNSCAFAYVDPSNVAPYISLAQQYGWANYMFQTNQGPSTPSHQFIFGGTDALSAEDDADALFVEELQPTAGCLAKPNQAMLLISPKTTPKGYVAYNTPVGTTCVTRDTMATLMDEQSESWKYYTPFGPAGFWTAPNWIRELCQPNSTYTECTGAEFNNNVDTSPADALTDIGNCNFSNMNWVIPIAQNSDHAGFKDGATGGPSWVSSVVNAIGQSTCTDTVNGQALTYWQDTAIFITWDDWGGWYDHEKPTFLSVPDEGLGDYQYGFRVPLVVVSAYTPAGYVDNSRHDFGSILRFVEQNFGVEEGALGFADARSTTDLTEFFTLSQVPRVFVPISAPLDAYFFLHDTRPPGPPDDY
jgi:phospholipase C